MPRYARFAPLLLFFVAFSHPSPAQDASPHAIRFIDAGGNVRLEVLDWGGRGTPLVLLAGGGNTAHVFDDFAPKLTGHHHVYGITRRGFGASGFAPTPDASDRLGEDVLAVLDALHLQQSIFVGHSLGGAELSWMATRHPERVARLVYLDAGYSYAFDNGKGSSVLDVQKLPAPQPPAPTPSDLSSFHAFEEYKRRVIGFTLPEGELRIQFETGPGGSVGAQRNFPGGPLLQSLLTSATKYSAIPVPALFIFANPHSSGVAVDNSTDPSTRSVAQAYAAGLTPLVQKQIDSVRQGLPSARVVVLPNAHHYVFLSNESAVLAAMHSFLDASGSGGRAVPAAPSK